MTIYAKPVLSRLPERRIASARRKFGIPARIEGCHLHDGRKAKLMIVAKTSHFGTALFVACNRFLLDHERRTT